MPVHGSHLGQVLPTIDTRVPETPEATPTGKQVHPGVIAAGMTLMGLVTLFGGATAWSGIYAGVNAKGWVRVAGWVGGITGGLVGLTGLLGMAAVGFLGVALEDAERYVT